MTRWQRERPILLAFRDQWSSRLALVFPEARISIEIDPDPEPGATIQWTWWITFVIDGAEFDALTGEGVQDLVFEDQEGRFEERVQPDQVIDHLRRRISAVRS